MMLGVRIGVCSDVHGRHDRLLAVLGAMAAAGVDERWCLGDLVGGEPVTAELRRRGSSTRPTDRRKSRRLGARTRPGRRPRTRRVQVVEPRKGQPSRHRLLARLAAPPPARVPHRGVCRERSCPTARWARSGSSAIRMNRRSSPTTAPLRARCGPFRASLTTGSRPAPAWPTRGRSAATRATRRAGGSSSTLTPVCCGGTARSSSPEKLPLPACEPRRSHRRVTRVVTGIRHRDQPSFQGDNDTVGAHILFPNPLHQFRRSGRHAAAGQRARDNHFKP